MVDSAFFVKSTPRVRATGRNCRQMGRKYIFGAKNYHLAKTSGKKKIPPKNRHLQ